MGSEQSTPMQPGKTPGLVRNLVSLAGAVIALIGAANVAFLVILDYLSSRPSPYIGILAYMIMPAIMVFGLLLIPAGMLLERRRRHTRAPSDIPRFPRIDLNDPRQRRTFASVAAFIIVFVALSAAGSYRAYEFTDSVQFCGQLCHKVMNPEYTAYLQSPHARVACVDCHVGAGAGWYVKSKLSGAYQVYAAAFNKYPRPIPTPVANLRPAPETCEQCHWPKKFHGDQLRVFTHFGTDENNTPRQIRMLVKTGGGDPATGLPSGIHWHMNIGNQITYIATDPQRQVIPWVEAKDLQGHVTVYTVKDGGLTPDQVQKGSKRRMDCIDCHNRPTHIYRPPDSAVDDAMLATKIDPSLPFIKQQAVTVLVADYKSTDEAVKAIDRDLTNFYQTKYPAVYTAKQASIKSSIAEVQRIFEHNIFPDMKVDWRVHPNNLGHFYSPGCFRCHDGNHVSADGKVLSKNCDTCHTIQSQVESGKPLIGTAQGVPFQHPVDLGDMTAVNCSDCHNGGVGP